MWETLILIGVILTLIVTLPVLALALALWVILKPKRPRGR